MQKVFTLCYLEITSSELKSRGKIRFDKLLVTKKFRLRRHQPIKLRPNGQVAGSVRMGSPLSLGLASGETASIIQSRKLFREMIPDSFGRYASLLSHVYDNEGSNVQQNH